VSQGTYELFVDVVQKIIYHIQYSIKRKQTMKFIYEKIENNFFEDLKYQLEGQVGSFIDFSIREMPEILFGYFYIMTKNGFISSIDGYCPKTIFIINEVVFNYPTIVGSVKVDFEDSKIYKNLPIKIRNHDELTYYSNESYDKFCIILTAVNIMDLVKIRISHCKTILLHKDSLVGFILEPL
jgi:hypothetical protein